MANNTRDPHAAPLSPLLLRAVLGRVFRTLRSPHTPSNLRSLALERVEDLRWPEPAREPMQTLASCLLMLADAEDAVRRGAGESAMHWRRQLVDRTFRAYRAAVRAALALETRGAEAAVYERRAA